jgi:hypothetical protein
MAMKISRLVFLVVTPCGLVDISEERTVSIFSLEHGGSMLLRNVGIYLRVHTALQPRRPTSTNIDLILKIM